MLNRRWHSNLLDVRRFRGADYDTDNYLIVVKVRESLPVNKQGAQKSVGERFNLSKLNQLQVRKQHQIEITNRVAALETLSNEEDINRAWENIKENIKTSSKSNLGVHELKQNRPCFDEECLRFLDQRKQATMH